MKIKPYKTVDEYIANFPPDTRERLQKVREAILEVIPDATERISYGIPTYWQGGSLVHFGGYSAHIGFYPGPPAIEEFAEELKEYETSKGTVKFPLDKPMPYDLIKKITHYSVGAPR